MSEAAVPILGPDVFTVERPVRFAMCDPAGIMYFPNYFDLFNGLIEDWLAELGFGWAETIPNRRFTTPIVHASCDYLRPSRMGDRLHLAALLTRLGRRSLELSIPVWSGEELRARGRMVHVAISLETYQSLDWPDDLHAALEAYRAACAAPGPDGAEP